MGWQPCVCADCGVGATQVSTALEVLIALRLALHGIFLYERVSGAAAGKEDHRLDADEVTRIVHNFVALCFHLLGLIGIRRWHAAQGRVWPTPPRGSAPAPSRRGACCLRVYCAYLAADILFSVAWNLSGVFNIEQYCEQRQETDCEESQQSIGILVLFAYQGVQGLTIWGVWSLFTPTQRAGHAMHHASGPVVAAIALHPHSTPVLLATVLPDDRMPPEPDERARDSSRHHRGHDSRRGAQKYTVHDGESTAGSKRHGGSRHDRKEDKLARKGKKPSSSAERAPSRNVKSASGGKSTRGGGGKLAAGRGAKP